MVDEETLVGGGVVVGGDGDDLDGRKLLLKGFEAGKLFEAGSAPAGPEVEDDDTAAIVAEVDGVVAVGDGELGCAAAELLRVIAAVAAGKEGGGEQGESGDCAADPARAG